MTTFTSSLPDKTWKHLSAMAKKMNKPKNQIIDEALNRYFTDMEKQQFLDSFERVEKDMDIQKMAAWGLTDYIDQLNKLDGNK